MRITDRWEAGYLRTCGFLSSVTDFDPVSRKVYWTFEDSPQLRQHRSQYARGANASVQLMKGAMADIWEEIEALKPKMVSS